MGTGASAGAPERAREARRRAWRGARWRARDAARSARPWMARAAIAEIMGAYWVAAGLVIFLVACASGPLSAVAWVPGPAMFILGALLVSAARLWGWHR